MSSRLRALLTQGLAVALSLFVLVEVNYPQLSPQSQLALFALGGLVLCFLLYPTHPNWQGETIAKVVDGLSIIASIFVCLYVVTQTEPIFESLWVKGMSLGDRAGAEASIDYVVGFVGVIVVIEAARRCLGWALPILAMFFLAYAYFGQMLPGWLFPHRGYPVDRIVAQAFLHSQGVFGIALKVMFSYVFLFVLLGALLDATGATQFIIHLAQRVFRGTPGGAAKVAVLSSGLMGSLSGSAVAVTATTGTFTIPLMRSIGFRKHIAAGVTAAASSGGALVPPVMGAGAYMMLEIVSPPVTYLEVIRAAILPAFIYYFALLLIVHFYSKRVGRTELADEGPEAPATLRYEGLVFATTLGSLILFLVMGYTVFRAVSLALLVVIVMSSLKATTRINWAAARDAFVRTARGGAPLVAAATSVGIILGIVTLTGIGTKFPSAILALSGENLLAALVLIMIGSIVLGMGLPSAVCYLLMATLIAPIIGELGVVPLAAHFFIFYFGMMSMVTPPVALASYTAASIAETNIMSTAFASFRFALVGFTLPFMFVFRPELLLLTADGGSVRAVAVLAAFGLAILGILPLAAGIAGYFLRPLGMASRFALVVSAALLLFPGSDVHLGSVEVSTANIVGLVVLLVVAGFQWRPTKETSFKETQ